MSKRPAQSDLDEYDDDEDAAGSSSSSSHQQQQQEQADQPENKNVKEEKDDDDDDDDEDEIIVLPVKPKQVRKKRRGPKAPISAVVFHRLSVLDEMTAAAGPDVNAHAIVKQIEARWNALSEKERLIFYNMEAKDRDRYNAELKNYVPTVDTAPAKKKKTKKHPDAPKHPKSAYLFFVGDAREKIKQDNPGKTFTEIAHILGERWRDLDQKSRVRYEKMADNDKERYRAEKKQYIATVGPDEDEKKQTKKKNPLPPHIKRPRAGYVQYISSNPSKLPADIDKRDFVAVAQVLGAKWKSLPPEEKSKYDAKAEADKKRYHAEKLAFLTESQKNNTTNQHNNTSQVPAPSAFTSTEFKTPRQVGTPTQYGGRFQLQPVSPDAAVLASPSPSLAVSTPTTPANQRY